MKRRKMKSRFLMNTLIRKALLPIFIVLILYLASTISSHFTTVRLPSTEHPVDLYANQNRNDLGLTFDQAIASAKHNITLMIYSLRDKAIINQLNNKSEEGVAIQIICDKEASAGVKRRLNKAIQVFPSNDKGLMHLKILVIDQQHVLMGSANMTGESLRLHGNLVTGFDSRPLAEFILARAQEIISRSPKKTVNKGTFVLGGQTVEFYFLPGNLDALHRIKDLIRSAQKNLRIAMFTWTRQDLAKTVADAARRGVDVEIVIDGNSAEGASQDVFNQLVSAGVNVRKSTGDGLLHHKMMIVDDAFLVNGSANWTKAAFSDNDDCFIVLNPLTEQQQKDLNAVWQVIMHESVQRKSP